MPYTPPKLGGFTTLMSGIQTLGDNNYEEMKYGVNKMSFMSFSKCKEGKDL